MNVPIISAAFFILQSTKIVFTAVINLFPPFSDVNLFTQWLPFSHYYALFTLPSSLTNHEHLLKTRLLSNFSQATGMNECNATDSMGFTALCLCSSSTELWWCPSPTSFLLMWCWCQLGLMLLKDIRHHWEATGSQPSVRILLIHLYIVVLFKTACLNDSSAVVCCCPDKYLCVKWVQVIHSFVLHQVLASWPVSWCH